MAESESLKRINKIKKTEYMFNETQEQIFNYIMEGKTFKSISTELKLSEYVVRKNVQYVKELTGLTSQDIKYIRDKNNVRCEKLKTEEKECQRLVGEVIAMRYLGIKDTTKFPSIMYIRISQLAKQYSYKSIYETLQRISKNLDYAFTHKTFNGVNNKISYILAAVKNNIEVVHKEIQEKENNKKDTKYLDNQVLEGINNIKRTGASKKKDFSEFLDNL